LRAISRRRYKNNQLNNRIRFNNGTSDNDSEIAALTPTYDAIKMHPERK